MPESAKDMRVTTGYRSHVINSGLIAWTFYEKRRQHRRIDEPTVKIGRRKRGRRKRIRTLESADASRVITDRTR